MDKKALKIINELDCITISSTEFRNPEKDFRLKTKGNAIELASRGGKFLPDWQGVADINCYPPILHLTRVGGYHADLKVKIPEPEGIERIMEGLGHVFVTFSFHKQGK